MNPYPKMFLERNQFGGPFYYFLFFDMYFSYFAFYVPIIFGAMLFVISSQNVYEIQVLVTYYLYQQSSRFEVKHQWKISEAIDGQTSIICGSFNAYSQDIDVVVLMLYASSPITVTIYGEKTEWHLLKLLLILLEPGQVYGLQFIQMTRIEL